MTDPDTQAEKIRGLIRELDALATSLEAGESEDAGAQKRLLERAEEALNSWRGALTQAKGSGGGVQREGTGILVVDDDETSRKLLVEYLSRFGPVDSADNGSEAVARVTRAIRGGKPYRMVFLDFMMPEMDGEETLGRIRHLEDIYSVSNPAVVAMTTALSDRGAVLRARRAGSEAYFVKPLDLGKIGKWMEGLGMEATSR